MRSSFSLSLLYHAYVYLEFLILACTIYILAPVQFETLDNQDNQSVFVPCVLDREVLFDAFPTVFDSWLKGNKKSDAVRFMMSLKYDF